jgi:GDP-4-dehydro-6-deoxy-D-mannose reductase
MRVLVTGGSGFVGRHLAALLVEGGCSTWSLDRRGGQPAGTTAITADLRDPEAAARAVAESRPDQVFHLAARTPANGPESTPAEWLGGDPVATHHLLDALRIHAPWARALVISSSAVYGNVPAEAQPIPETSPLQPTTLYGVAKASVELVALRFHATHGLHVVRARPFNLVGPGEPSAMLTSTLATQVARIRRGEAPAVVRMRHRATARDYLDVRDAVRAYRRLIAEGEAGEVYNVCSGRAVAIGELVDHLLAIAGVEAAIEETAHSPSPGDITTQAGDARRLAGATGWAPEIPLDRSLADLLAALGSPPQGSGD